MRQIREGQGRQGGRRQAGDREGDRKRSKRPGGGIRRTNGHHEPDWLKGKRQGADTDCMTIRVLCCYCGLERIDGVWGTASPVGEGERVSHGVCPTCYKKQMDLIRNSFKGKELEGNEKKWKKMLRFEGKGSKLVSVGSGLR